MDRTLMNSFTTRSTAIAAAAVYLSLSAGQATAQTKIYDWTGGVSQDWATAANWTVVEDPIGTPVGAPAVAAPDLDTDAGIAAVAGFPIISSGAQQAFIVKVGGTAGPGRLDITGGSLETDNDFEIGADDTGTVNINDTNGPVSIVIGDDLNVDREVFGVAYNSTVVVSGDVTIEVNDRIELGAQGDDLSEFLFDFQGGTLRAGDDIRVRGAGAAEMRVSGGLVEGADDLDVDTLLSLSGDGVVRVEELTDVSSFDGAVTIDDQALLQISTALTPLSQIEDYITNGVFSTSGPGLTVDLVSITGFFGAGARDFYQVSVVPEPASGVMLLALLSVGLRVRRRATR